MCVPAKGVVRFLLLQMITSMQIAIARTTAPATNPMIKGSFDGDGGAQYAVLFGLGHRNGLPSYLFSHAPAHE
jgi:hypothetical protein